MWRIAATAPRSKHSIFQKRPSSSLTPIVGRSIGTSPVAKPTKRFAKWRRKVASWVSLASAISSLPGNRLHDGVNHYKRMFDITDGLIRRGYSDADIELILGGNFRRVLGQIWNTKV
ncbi:MAG: hypothetical protein DMF41_10645 [Verrucomicrobia bacterium]|nr:MAG: hypothetical protein DMF41_10645 [Verrucomicrobiota bacterium]